MTDTPDVVDAVLALKTDHPTWALRRQRDKVVAATQGSYDAMFSLAVQGLAVQERLLVALHACRVSKADALAAHYRQRLANEGAHSAVIAAVNAGESVADLRLRDMLAFCGKLIERPIEGDRAAVQALADIGLSTPAIVALTQLIAFVSYQIRLAAGLAALAAVEVSA